MMPIIKPANIKLWIPMQDDTPTVRAVPGATMSTITKNGSPSLVAGKIGSCLSFDSSAATKQYLTSDYKDSAPSDTTFCAWIKPTLTSVVMYLFSNAEVSNATNADSCTISIEADNKLYGSIFDNAGSSYALISTTNALTSGVWQFIAGVFNHTTKKVIIFGNNVFYTSTAFTGGAGYRSENFVIGCNKRANIRYYNGLMSHVFVWNTALSEKEIAVLYQSTKGAYLL